MSQHDFVISDQGMPAARADLNAGLQALASTSKGPAAPATPYAGQLWLDDDTPSATTWTLNLHDGVDWIPLGQFNSTTNVFTPTNAAMLTIANVFTKTQTWFRGADVASAAALTLGDGNIFNVTGVTAITSIGTKGVGTLAILRFTGILTLTHHATNLVLIGAANITTAAGDYAIVEEYGAGTWRMVTYQRASGVPLLGAGTLITAGTALNKNPLTLASTTTQAHGLAGVPKYVQVMLECITIDNAWDVGDVILLSSSSVLDANVATGRGAVVAVDATNIRLFLGEGDGTGLFAIPDEDNTTSIYITAASWKITATPYYWV